MPALLLRSALSLRLCKLTPYGADDFFGRRCGRQEAEITAVLAEEIDEAGVIDCVVAAARRAGGRVVNLVGQRDFPDRGIRPGQRDQPRVERRNVIGKMRRRVPLRVDRDEERSEEHTSELQSHSFISYAVF